MKLVKGFGYPWSKRAWLYCRWYLHGDNAGLQLGDAPAGKLQLTATNRQGLILIQENLPLASNELLRLLQRLYQREDAGRVSQGDNSPLRSV